MAKYAIESYEADVLVIGGGIAGLFAAIKAREQGASVIVLEKSNALRSGAAGSGIDHIQSYVPEVHEKVSYTVEDMIQDQLTFGYAEGGLRRPDLIDFFIRNMYDRMLELEKYGLKFRFEDSQLPGQFRLVPQWHHVPTSFNFEGRDIKPVLTQKALEAGVHIINRAHVRELLKHEDAVTGAIAVSTRDFLIYTVTSKTTILATYGGISRLAKAEKNNFESYGPPSSSVGSGKLLAANAGAEVVNLEFINLVQGYSWVDYSFTVGLPSGSFWPAGRVVDEAGNVVVERTSDLPLDEPDYKAKYRAKVKHYQEQRGEIAKRLAKGEHLYFDLQEATDEELDYILWTLTHEGKTGLLVRHFASNHVDLRKVRFPLKPGLRNPLFASGVWLKDSTAETGVRNLYAAGNELAGTGLGGASNAVVFGIEAGIQAAARAKTVSGPEDVSASRVASIQEQLKGILHRENGDSWQEGEAAIQNLLDTYLGKPYSADVLDHLADLLQQYRERLALSANNPHELSRCLEVLDLYEIGELTLAAIKERKSSLGAFIRLDEDKYAREEYGVSIAITKPDGVIRTSRVNNLAYAVNSL